MPRQGFLNKDGSPDEVLRLSQAGGQVAGRWGPAQVTKAVPM